jgi:CHAD domain-containing protein
MSYRLQLDVPAPEAVRRVAEERLEKAAGRLSEDHGDDPVKAVHGARKDLKKTRSALRLARPCLPRRVYRRENKALRDLGRQMSGGRDADVMVETVDALAERYAGQLPKRQFTTLRQRFARHAAQAREEAEVGGLADALAGARERAGAWPLGKCDDRALRAGAERAYARGREAFAVAEEDPSAERLHDWRKRAKDLWYHHRLLADAWSGPVKAFADEADRLGKLLGDDHDLATLSERLGDIDVPPSVDVDTIEQLIAARRAELQSSAFEIGRRLYAEKPKAFARRLSRYLAAARDGGDHGT